MGKKIVPMSKTSVQLIHCPALHVLVDKYATEYPVNGKSYFSLPFWFEKNENGIVMHFIEPEDLGHFIAKAHLGNPNPQPIKKA